MKLKDYKLIIGALVASVAIAGTASAQIIGIDFENGTASTPQTPGSSASAGPVATTGWYNNYNVAAASGTALSVVDNTDTATGGTFSFTQGGTAKNGNSIYSSSYGAQGTGNATYTADQQLFNGAASAQGYDQQLNIANIPYATFNVYVLVEAPVGNQGYGNAGYFDEGSIQLYTGSTAGTTDWFSSSVASIVPASGFSYVAPTSNSATSPTLGANYAEFSLTGGAGTTYSFDIHAPQSNPGAGSKWFGGVGDVTAVEIVDTAESGPVPEPSTYALMLAGFGLLVIFARRRRTA